MHRTFFALGLFLAIIGFPRGASADLELEAKERNDAFAWFDTLGYPDLKEVPLVRVEWAWKMGADKLPEAVYLVGFLTDEEPLTVVTPDLATVGFTHWTDLNGRPGRPRYETAEFAPFAAKFLQDASTRERIGDKLSLRTQQFVLAWVCHRKGHAELAKHLCDRSFQMRERSPRGDARLTFRQRLAEDLANAEMWRGIESFEKANLSREDLLASFQRIVMHFPESPHSARARETAALLTKMIQEDGEQAEAAKRALPFDRLPRREQVSELVFRLRDQNDHQLSEPGFYDNFFCDKTSSAHQLVDIGLDAVPQLIEALGDERFTRSVSCHRSFYFSHTVLRVHDCALTILERIAGRTFRTSYGVPNADNPAALQAAVAKWHSTILRKGEKQVAIEGIEAGDNNSPKLARRLLSTDPEAASAAILVGARKSTDSLARAEMTEILGKSQEEDALAFLLEEVVRGPYARSRLAAAAALQDRGRPEGVDAMIAEWERGSIGKKDEWSSFREAIIAFLEWSNEPKAVRSLERTFAQRPVEDRLEIVRAFRRGHSKRGWAGNPRKAAYDLASPETKRAIRELFLLALEDTEERKGTSGSFTGQQFADPRICDMAGYVLSTIDPEKYPFKLSADIKGREQARWVLKVALQSER